MAGSGSGRDREVLLEFQQIGNAVKVTAVDPVTMTEVSIVGPAGSGEEVLKRTVIEKLNYVLGKKHGSPRKS